MSYLKHTNLQRSYIVISSCLQCPHQRDLDMSHKGISLARCRRKVRIVGPRKHFTDINPQWPIPCTCTLDLPIT